MRYKQRCLLLNIGKPSHLQLLKYKMERAACCFSVIFIPSMKFELSTWYQGMNPKLATLVKKRKAFCNRKLYALKMPFSVLNVKCIHGVVAFDWLSEGGLYSFASNIQWVAVNGISFDIWESNNTFRNNLDTFNKGISHSVGVVSVICPTLK